MIEISRNLRQLKFVLTQLKPSLIPLSLSFSQLLTLHLMLILFRVHLTLHLHEYLMFRTYALSDGSIKHCAILSLRYLMMLMFMQDFLNLSSKLV